MITDRDTGRSRGYGFVELGPEDDAARVIGELNGTNVEGSCAPGQRSTLARIAWWRTGFSGGRSGGDGRRSY